MVFTEKEALIFLQNEHKEMFNKNPSLVLLYPKKIETNLFEITGIIDPTLSTERLIDDKNISFLDYNFKVEIGSKFELLSSENPNILKFGDRIINKYRSDSQGSVGFFFKLKNTSNYYLTTNKHVIGREEILNDKIEKLHFYDDLNGTRQVKKINLGKYKFGIINNVLDLAVVKLDIEINLLETNIFQLNIRPEFYLDVTINNMPQNIISKNAYVKISDNYYYNPAKILENQIISNFQMNYGDSGSIVLDKEQKVIGHVFAKNSKFSVINRIDEILNYISKELNIDTNQIEIINKLKI